jgi:hypothetical protein
VLAGGGAGSNRNAVDLTIVPFILRQARDERNKPDLMNLGPFVLSLSKHQRLNSTLSDYAKLVIPAGKRVSSAMDGKRKSFHGTWIPAICLPE